MMYCERCNAEFHEEMKYCKWCGQTLIERQGGTAPVPKCSSCASPLQPGWTFCNTCGAKVTTDAQAAASPLCLRCGAVVSPGATSCLRCGHRFTTERSAIQDAGHPGSVQYCLTCGEALEAGKLYCKTCGAPVQNAAAPADSLFPAQGSSIGTPENPPTLPTQGAEATLLLDQTGGQSGPSPQRTELYQSFKPQTPQPEANATIDLRQQQKASPAIPPAASEAPPEAGKTIAYSAFTPAEAERLAKAEGGSQPAQADRQLSAADLQADPDPYTAFQTVQEMRAPNAKEEEFTFEITPLEAPAKQPEAKQQPGFPGEPPPATMHLQMDALPFESTVQEDTGLLKPNRPTTKLTPSEYAKPAADETASEPVAENAAAGDLATTVIEPPPLKALPPEPAAVVNQAAQAHPPATPAAPAWQKPQPAATPWPENKQGGAPPVAKKKGGSPIALIAATIVLIALGGAAIWWFVLRQPAGEVVSPNSNTTTTGNANLSVANSNSSTANSNTSTTSTPLVPEGMVTVAAGEYTIGREDGDEIEKPKHTVPLKAFFIDRTEVTNAEYKKFIDATSYQAPPHWKDKNFPEGQANFPVVQVNWQDASAYAQWAGKRLPTEAEWEAAARGLEARKYPWGNQWSQSFANIGAGEKGSLSEVGKFPEGQSPCGALDMIGNAWEWTADTLSLYPGNSGKAPEEAGNTAYRVIRGGAFNGTKNNDASYRGYIEANTNRKELDKTGFRCVKDAN
jgi:gamma-glutamyl hercynylcysteine S-oxide synthase